MIHLLDDSLSANAQNAYINVPTYDSCAKCDPQQDLLPSDCTAMVMASAADYSSPDMDIPAKLRNLVTFLAQVGIRDDQADLAQLSEQSRSLTGKSPVRSQLDKLTATLERSTDAIDILLDSISADSKGLRLQGLKIAVQKEEDLTHAINLVKHAATSGKDCRAAEMLIQ
jgi:hypothetical protein